MQSNDNNGRYYSDNEESDNKESDNEECCQTKLYFGKQYNTTTLPTQIKKILEMYFIFHCRFPNLFTGDFASNDYFGGRSNEDNLVFEEKMEYNLRYDLKLLNFNCPEKHRLTVFNKYGYIILNTYDPILHKYLVVGCGHHPIELNMDLPDSQRYSNEHAHSDCYTIDPDICKNADTIGVYGEQKFKHLRNGAFEEILTEGVRIKITSLFMNETERLLKEGGCLRADGEVFLVKKNGKLLFSKLFRGIGLYLGLPDIYDWNNTHEIYGKEIFKVTTGKWLPRCHHPISNLKNGHITIYDEDEMDILFLTINVSDFKIVIKDVGSYNHRVGSTLYYLTFMNEGKKMLDIRYSPKHNQFIKSDEKLLCGHVISVEHESKIMDNIHMMFTAETGVMKYLVFKLLTPEEYLY